jgi:methionyl-tRNA formyltransferase
MSIPLPTKRILFMGSPDFGISTLERINADARMHLVGVITQPDKQKGRGKRIQSTAVKQWALNHQIDCMSPISKTELVNQVYQFNPDYIVVIAYGVILPSEIVSHYYCINGHASLLPYYRGASPIQSVLLNHESSTGMTIIKMNQRMDEGDILAQSAIDITDGETFETLYARLRQLCSVQIQQTLHRLIQTRITPTPQSHQNATYCRKLNTADRELKPSYALKKNDAIIRAFSPKPGAFIQIDGQRIKVIAAHITDSKLEPTIVQPEGKTAMSYADYLRGGYPHLCLQNESYPA